MGVGSIRFSTGELSSKGAALFKTFISVPAPYEVFKQIKTVSVDVKTDWNYPNKLRPEENPGYNTEYKPEEKEKPDA